MARMETRQLHTVGEVARLAVFVQDAIRANEARWRNRPHISAPGA